MGIDWRWSPYRAAGKADDHEEIKAILPKKTLGELARLLADGDDDIRYERGENHLSSKSVDGC